VLYSIAESGAPPQKPDLTVTAINNETIYNGTYNIVIATVKNVGNGSAGTFNVTLNDGSGVVDEVVVTGLGAGASTEVILVWVPTTSGGYTLNATVDANNDVAEWNENNNTKTKSVTASEIPPTDLVVSEVCDGNLINGTDNEVFAAVKNEGAYTSGFNVSLEADGVEVDKAFVPMLHFRESQLVTFHWTPTSEGSVQLNVTVDSDGQIAESDESNNAASQCVDVVTRNVRTVSGGSIQGAINNAEPYDIILVNDGIYNEQITIPASKPGIKLIANGSDVVICSDTAGDIVTVEGNYCKVEGFKINSTWDGSIYLKFSGAGINVTSEWNVIANNYIYNSAGGIKLYGSKNLIRCNTVGDSAEGRACLNLMAISGDCNAIVKNKFDGDTGYGWILGGTFTPAGIRRTSASNNLVRGNNFTITGVGTWDCGKLIFGGCRNLVFNNIIDDTSNKVQLEKLNWYFVDKVAVENPKCGNVVHGPFYGGNFWLNYTGTDSNNDLLGDTGVPHMGYDYHPLIKALCGDVDCNGDVDMGDYGKLNDYVSGTGTVASIWASDVDCSGDVDMGDYGKLNDYVSAVIPSLNCCKGCEG